MSKWSKLGQIFDPRHHDLGEGIVGFAQSPQAVPFDEFVRIYFSSRKLSKNGKFLSVIRFVDIDKTLENILYVHKHDVIDQGQLGNFDEHGIFPFNVIKMGQRFYGYTSGWSRRQSVSVETSIGLAISDDGGKKFVRYGNGPIMTASINEPFLVGDPFVMEISGRYHMWYIFGTKWEMNPDVGFPERVYKIGHSTSTDGISWERGIGRQIIEDKIGDDECQALPTVIKINEQFHIFFCYRYMHDFRRNKEFSYRIGHASSTDLITWNRDDETCSLSVSEHGWDSQMVCYPHVFEYQKQVYLLYNGNSFGEYGFGIARLEQD